MMLKLVALLVALVASALEFPFEQFLCGWMLAFVAWLISTLYDMICGKEHGEYCAHQALYDCCSSWLQSYLYPQLSRLVLEIMAGFE